MTVKNLLLIFIIFQVLNACTADNSTKPEEVSEKTIIKTENLNIQGKASGLPPGTSRLYLSLFTDFTTNTGSFDFQFNLDRFLRSQFQELGLVLIDKIQFSQVIVSGKIDSFIVSTAERVTNIPSLLYSLSINYSVLDKDNNYLQKDKMIREDLLVLDTNTYLSNTVADLMLKDISKHTAEAVYYGWQLDYSRTANKINTLGGSNETSNGLDWGK